MAKQHDCDKAPDLAVLKKEFENMDHVINGNGKRGLRDDVTTLTEVTNGLKENVEGLVNGMEAFRTAISGFQIFMEGVHSERKQRDKQTATFRWIIGTLIVIIMLLFGNGILK
jgi:hypothetical protein